MNRTILLLLATAAVSACANDGMAIKKPIASMDTDCKVNVRGRTDTRLKYGKDDIDIKWKSHVGRNTEFRILLKPKPGYDDKKVKIVGKWGKLPPPPAGSGLPTSPDWLNIEKSAKELENEGKKAILVLCVPSDVPVGTEYKFDVVIESMGTLDPRADVTW